MAQHLILALASAHRQSSVHEQPDAPLPTSSCNNLRAERCVADLLLDCSAAAEDLFHQHKHLCESPIECVAFAALLAALPDAEVFQSKEKLKDRIWETAIVPQMSIGGYRVDFAVMHRPTKIAYGLECDGRDST